MEAWELNGYEQALCMHCPKTEHGELDLNMELAVYADCPRDLCEIAETYRVDAEESTKQ